MENLLNTIRKNMQAAAYQNEEAVRSQICYPLLAELGWDIHSPQKLIPEFKVSSRRVDIALCGLPNQPSIFIEVKAIGKCSPEGEDQLFEYASGRGGIPMIILTDGNEWHFYNSYGSGDYDQRKVYTLDISQRKNQDCIDIFQRYLNYDRVKTGQAFNDLQQDYQKSLLANQARISIPKAWEKLVADKVESLIDLLAEETGKLCGHRPQTQDVTAFLCSLKSVESRPIPAPHATVSPPQPVSPSKPLNSGDKKRKYASVTHRYKIDGKIYEGRNGKDVYIKAMDSVISKYGRFEELKNQDWNKSRSQRDGSIGYHISQHNYEIPKEDKWKSQLLSCKIWVNNNLSAGDMERKLKDIGKFYNQALGKNILGEWDSGAEIEYSIPTRPLVS